MNDWKPTHRTRPGVKVVIAEEYGAWHVKVLDNEINSAAIFTTREIEALFEPIPKPVMVEISLDVAKDIRSILLAKREYVLDEILAAAQRAAQDKT